MPRYEVTGPDGGRYEVTAPEGASEQDIMSYVQQNLAPKSAKQPIAPVNAVDATDMAVSGLSFGLADEMRAGAAGLAGGIKAAARDIGQGQVPSFRGVTQAAGDKYNERLAGVRAAKQDYRERRPILSTAAELAGGLATGGTAAKGGLTLLNMAKPTARGLAVRGAAEGAVYGGLYGAGNADGGIENRLESAALNAAIGAGTGGVLGAGAGAIANRNARAAIPSSEALKTQSQVAYKTAENAGVVFKPQAYEQMVDDISAAVKKGGIDKTIHPDATAALKRLEEARGSAPSLEDIEILRRVAKSAAASIKPDESRVASIIVDKIDEFVDGISPQNIMAGDQATGAAALKEARALWSRMRKSDVVDDLIDRAKLSAPNFSASGMENALRTEFRQLAKNAKKMRGFTKEEQAAIRDVATGGPVRNALRYLGKFAPTGIVSTALSGGTGAMIGGPIGAVALPAAGYAARNAAASMTQNAAQRAGEVMRAGRTGMSQMPLSLPAQAAGNALLLGVAQRGSSPDGMLPPELEALFSSVR